MTEEQNASAIINDRLSRAGIRCMCIMLERDMYVSMFWLIIHMVSGWLFYAHLLICYYMYRLRESIWTGKDMSGPTFFFFDQVPQTFEFLFKGHCVPEGRPRLLSFQSHKYNLSSSWQCRRSVSIAALQHRT